MTNGKILGLDIGISSVGVGIIEKETGEIVHSSVRLFNAVNANNNAERRQFRSGRRVRRRKKHRIKRVGDLFDKYEIDVPLIHTDINPYEIRVKGLTQQITVEELFVALRHLVKRRGISYLDDLESESIGSSEYAKSIEYNRNLLQEMTPGQIQHDRFLRYGQVRGHFDIKTDDGSIQRVINVFTTSEYCKEAERILRCQKEYHAFITDHFINDYLTILKGKRKYYEGPGNEKSRTDYGRFKTSGDTLENIFDALIGKCKYYPTEFRAAKNSYTAQEFNFLNDLNNLTVPTETGKLSEKDKRELVEIVKSTSISNFNGDKLIKLIAKKLSISEDEISGYRTDAKDKPDLHTFDMYRKMKQELFVALDVDDLDRETLDILGHILTLNTDRESIEEACHRNLKGKFTPEQILEIVAFRKNKSSDWSKGWHNLSKKIMLEIIPELYATSDEQMAILTRLDKTVQKTKESQKTVYLDETLIVEDIYNPVVAKSVKQAIKIINASVKKWGHFDKIVIEMPRDANSDEEKKRITNAQQRNKKDKDDAEVYAAEKYLGTGKKLPQHVFHGYKDLALRIRLWHQQEETCLYSGKKIEIQDLIHNRQWFEVDHILPLSLSFDDSPTNKVLVYREYNQEKGQRTPYQALGTMKSAWKLKKFIEFVKNSKKMSNKKKEYLLTQEDITKYDVQQQFIARNLVDTRYASKIVLNTLQELFKKQEITTKLGVVRGQFTAQLRKRWGVIKTRETYHHHAIDALVVAASSQLKLWKREDLLFSELSSGLLVNIETGEVLSESDYKKEVFTPPYQKFVETISSKSFEDRILFSHQVDSKVNRKVSDATIYGTRKVKLAKDKKEETYVVSQIDDIYVLGSNKDTKTGFYKFLNIYNKDKTKFMIYQKDRMTWDNVIEPILRHYRKLNDKQVDIVNPFEEYRKENGPVKKYSKKDIGPEIKSFKYYDTEMGKHLDITPTDSKNKVILQSINPWRTDVYFNPESMKYELMGIKYSDLSFMKDDGGYGISLSRYNQIKKIEGVSEISQFKFSLHKNDLVLFKHALTGEVYLGRFHSRNDTSKNYVQLKPYDKAKFLEKEKLPIFGNVATSGQFIKNFSIDKISVYKVKTDVLGNKFFIKDEEGPVLRVDRVDR